MTLKRIMPATTRKFGKIDAISAFRLWARAGSDYNIWVKANKGGEPKESHSLLSGDECWTTAGGGKTQLELVISLNWWVIGQSSRRLRHL